MFNVILVPSKYFFTDSNAKASGLILVYLREQDILCKVNILLKLQPGFCVQEQELGGWYKNEAFISTLS